MTFAYDLPGPHTSHASMQAARRARAPLLRSRWDMGPGAAMAIAVSKSRARSRARSRGIAMAVATALVLGLGCGPAASPLPTAGPNAIEITVRTEPPGGTVIVDGAPVGTAPVQVRLNPGPHRVRASMSGYYPAPETRLQVGAAEPRELVLTLVASH